MFTQVRDAIDFIENQRINNTSLEKFKDLLKKHNDFHKQSLYVHTTGTNGKGSTSKMINDILISAGYDVGLFTSPHMVVSNDRVRFNNQYISDEDLIKYVNLFHDDILEYELNFFQIYTLIALRYFYDMACNIVIIEVGIGGLYDSTNVIDGIISIITNINMDHVDKLGASVEEIAYQKAGIIKEHNHTITMVKQEGALKVIRDKANSVDSNLSVLETTESTIVNHKRDFYFEDNIYSLNSLARYQVDNALIALYAIKILREEYSFEVSHSQEFDALQNFSWFGRFEVVSKDPYIVLDGAHNVAGIETLVQEDLSESVVIFSALKDKEYKKMLKLLKGAALDVVFCEFDFYRALKMSDLEHDDVKKMSSVDEALKYYYERYRHQRIVICGSLYFISDVRKIIKGE